MLQEYGSETTAKAAGLPVSSLPATAASGDGNDTVFAGGNGDQIFGGGANNVIHGGAGPDTIVGGPASDTITGGGGNELIIGRGTDTINGGTGNDTIEGGPGNSTIYGDTGNDLIQGGNGNNTITGGSGNDTILSGAGNDTIVGGSGNDSIRGEGGNDTIQGGSGNDIIDGYAGGDTIYGGTGNDTIDGDAGSDTILGGTGTDVIYGDNGIDNTLFGGQGSDYLSAAGSSDDQVFGGSGDSTIYGGVNNDTLSGGEGADCIFGGTGPDQITGGSGNDTITGGGGFNIILGGTGNNSIQGGTAGDLIHGGDGGDTIAGGAGPETIYAGALPSLITAGTGEDLLVGGASQDTIAGGVGDDTIYAGSAPGNVLSGGAGNDLIYGTDSIGTPGHGDTITGGTGNATIHGSAGDDSITGGSGNDDIYAGMGNQTIVGGTGSDLIDGGPGNDSLMAGTGTADVTTYGGTGNDTIVGNAGDDLLYGGSGTDLIEGGAGSNVIYGGTGGGTQILAGAGNDTIWASTGGHDSISGGTGNVEIFAEGGSNTIVGGTGNDTIEGELTGNLISGGSGNDLLVGGDGNDTINAGDPSQSSPGTGQDTIYGDVSGNDSVTGNAGNDQIYAGAGTNTIVSGSGPGTQVYNPGVASVVTYAETPVPEQNPVLTAAANAAAALPANVATSGVWATLAGGNGSILGTPTTNDGGPAIAASATARYVAWIDIAGGIPAVYVVTETGSAWNQLAGSAQGGGISGLLSAAAAPAIALLASGQPIVAWTAQTVGGSDIDVAEYSPAANGGAGGWVALGGSLSAGGISQTGKASNAQILLVNGQPTVVWLDASGGVSNIYAARWSGSSWVALGSGATSGGGISGSSLAVTQFAAATDGTRIAVAWTQDFAAAPSQIYLRQYSGGTWSALSGSASGTGISQGLYAASAPTVAYAGGSLFAAWRQYISNPAQSETIFQQAPVIYAAEYAGTAWQPAGTGAETGFGVSGNPDVALAPKLASNGTQLMLAWSDEFIDSSGINSFLTNISPDSHLYVLTWNGSAFAQAQPGQASGEGVAQSDGGLDELSLTLDPNGNPFAAWADAGDALPALRVMGTLSPSSAVTVATPSTLAGLLSGPNAGDGDVIYLTAGSYSGAIALSSANAGVTLVGQPGLGAVLDGSVTVGGVNVTLQGVTVSGDISASGSGFALRESQLTSGTLTLTGANQVVIDNVLEGGVSLLGATNVVLRGNTITASGTTNGIEIGPGNGGTIDHNIVVLANIGIDIANAFTGAILDNEIVFCVTGVNYFAAAALSGNQITFNTTGVNATVNNSSGGFGFVAGSGVNTISGNTTGVQLAGQMQNQVITGNVTGVSGTGTIGGDTLSLANDINANTTGIGEFTGTIQFNRIDGNGTGISATSNLQILHNLIYNNTTVGLEVSSVSNVQTSDNTFYTATGDNIRIENGSSNVEIQNSILWALNGYDIYVGNDSQSGFFSDYNTLYAGPNGILVYWTRNFTDILDWQDDVGLYDLHSVGSTVVNPTDGMPRFVDANDARFQLLPLVGGQTASDAALEQGNPIAEYDVPAQSGNLLSNPGFEQGLTDWTTDPAALAGVAPDGPAAYDGANYFYAGPNTASGYAQQQVNLLQGGYSPTQIDSGTLTISFGGYTRSLAASTPDQGSITVSFIGASGTTVLGTMTVDSTNPTTQWTLTSGTAALPVGTRFILYQFNANRETASDDNAYLDDAFVSLSAVSGPQSAVPGIGANYLSNPGFESGLDGWTSSPGSAAGSSGQQTGYPAAFTGGSYYVPGAVQQGFVTQTVKLLNSGLSASQIDAGGLNLVFGGRVISANSFPPDQGQITITLLAADDKTVLGSTTVQAPNITDRWALVGGTTALLAGTRYVQYTFTATEQTGGEAYDGSFLDDAFVSTSPIGVATSDGAYSSPAVADSTSGAAQITLTAPVLYVNWADNAPHVITWNNYGTAAAANQSVTIELYQETPVGNGLPGEPKLLETIATVPNTGSYTWIPTPATVPYGTEGLIIQVSLVSDPAVAARSTEPFTVPPNGDTYYVNDGSTANAQYTTAPASNRNDGLQPSQPLPDIDNVSRNYTLTSGSVIQVDPGFYAEIDPVDLSGIYNYGLGIDQGFTIQGPTNGSAAILTPAIPGNPVNLIQLEDANLVTVNDLTLQNAGRGVLVQNSAGFSATGLTIAGMANEGIRIDSGSTVTLLDDITVTSSGLSGIYVDGTAGTISAVDITNSGSAKNSSNNVSSPMYGSGLYINGPVAAISGTFADNFSWGVYLADPGSVSVTDSTIFGNEQGLYVYDDSGSAIIGDPVLTDNAGNVIHDNVGYGIFATGTVTVTGNVVYNEGKYDTASLFTYGIEAQAGASATENVVYASAVGILDDDGALISANRVYDNAMSGIYDFSDDEGGNSPTAITLNVIYSNGTGITDQRDDSSPTVLIGNNLIYANTTAAIAILGNDGITVVNNTIDQPTGVGVSITDANSGTHLSNNIFAIGAGTGIVVGPASETGFASDYNMFWLTNATAGAIGEWQNAPEITLAAWQATTLTDAGSFTGNPLFVNPTGAEGVLGYVSPSQPGYDDDFHLQSEYQDFRGGGTAPIIGSSGKPVFPAIVGGADAAQSPAIDRGAPTSGYANEPAPNGDYINLGDFGNTAQAAESPAEYILVLAPAAGVTLQDGATAAITWRSSGFTGAVNLAYSTNGTTFTSIASGITNSGSYTWTVPSGLAAGNTYVIQVSAVSASVSALSAQFSVSPKITNYYVNDGTPGQYTTAPGGNSNNGLSPATPKLSIQALLTAYTLGAGDIIYVDGGTYTLTTNINLGSKNSGTSASDTFSIIGPTSGTPAVLSRGNLNSGVDVFDIQGGSYITIENLTITGANVGVELGGASAGVLLTNDTVTANSDIGIEIDFNSGTTKTAVTGLVIQNDVIDGNGLNVEDGTNYGSDQDGVLVRQGNGGVRIVNDQVYDNNQAGVYLADGDTGAGVSTVDGGAYYGQNLNDDFYTGYGIYDAAGSLIENVQAYANLGDGINSINSSGSIDVQSGTVTGSTVFGNTDAGIYGDAALISGNLVYNQLSTSWDAIDLNGASTGTGNTVFGGTTGIYVDPPAEALANVVYDESGAGIWYGASSADDTPGGGPVSIFGNTVYGDGIGIYGTEYAVGTIVPIDGNLIYQNTTDGISLIGGRDQSIVNNTIDEPAGSGISITGAATATAIENNIIEVGAGPGIVVSANSESGFSSDYNLFDLTGSAAAIGTWEGIGFTSLANWYYELGLDQHSQTGNPDFVSPAGANDVLGFGAPTGATQVIDNSAASEFSTTGKWTMETGSGLGGTELETAAGSGATATWTFTGLTIGQTYEIGATWSGLSGIGNARYTVTDSTGAVLTGTILGQYNGSSPTGITASGTTFAVAGQFVATGSSAAVTVTGDAADAVLADATVLVPVGVNGGAGDNFHVQPGSPAIDAGDPTTPSLLEPGPNGGRVNLGYDGDTAEAQTSPSATAIQVLSPAGLAKYQVGASVPINFGAYGLLASQPILLLHAGGAAIGTALDGNWSGDAFRMSGTTVSETFSATQIGTLAGIPAALFSTAAEASGGNSGQSLNFDLPVPNGSYTMTLYFADPQATAAGQTVFNIVANGATLQSNYDIFAAAKAVYNDGHHAVSLTLSVTVTGGQGLALDFVNGATNTYGALVNGIELNAANPGGTTSPTATVQVSTDGGTTWSQIASGVSINPFGQGQFVWTAPAADAGDTALVRVLSGTASGTSSSIQLANNGTIFYVNDASQVGDQYTTEPGNDANTGKTADQPMQSVAALLRAYPIGPGDTIEVDAGTYNLPTNIVLPAADSGSAAAPVLITGPTNGAAAIFNRADTATGTDVIDLSGVSDIVIQNLTLKGAYNGVEISNTGSRVTLLNDTVTNNSNLGIEVFANAAVLLKDDQVSNTGGAGLYLSGGGQTVMGGAYDNDGADGIYGSAPGVLVEGVVAYGDTGVANGDGIDLNGGTVSGSTVFGNLLNGIVMIGGLVSGNLVYDQLNASGEAIHAENGATATGDTVYGNVDGIFAGTNAIVEDNVAYDNSGAGILYINAPGLNDNDNGPASISGNTVYDNGIGISGNDIYAGVTIPIANNLIYQNATAGISLTNGFNQQVVNNTIDELTGAGIWISGTIVTTTIENNIIAVTAGPALQVAPAAENGLVSDYNFFDLSGTGAVGSWEAISYGSLSGWYYATGLDQHSQTGDPDFVDPAGANGDLGFLSLPGTASVITVASPSGYADTGVWTSATGTGGAGTSALQTAAGSGGTATWSFSGLTPGAVYQVAANWPMFNSNEGEARYTVRDANGVVIAQGVFNQNDVASSGLTADSAGFNAIGQITATTGAITVTLSGVDGAEVIADAAFVQEVGINEGADDDFHLVASSPAIDAGNPASPFTTEPAPNGGRVNQGYDGDTPAAQTGGSTQTLFVTNPAQYGKYEVGQLVPIDIAGDDLGQSQAVLLMAAGGGPIVNATEGNWQAGAFQTTGTSFTNTASITGLSGIPNALFANGAEAANATPGTALNFALPAANGGYTLRLFFADANSTAAGQDVFNIVVNGTTLVANYDAFAAAGGQNKAVELDLPVNVSGGTGVNLSFVNASGTYDAFVNGIELDQAVPGALTPLANIAVSTNNGQTWSTIATDVPINRFGQAQYDWTVDRTSAGSTALIRVTSGTVTATSQPFLLANGGTSFYINDESQTGDQYTTAIGNDANSGKSPDQPMESLAALLRAYPIGPGDTIFVDTGNYLSTTPIVLPASESGTLAEPVVITGPPNGGTAVIDRGNTVIGTGVIDDDSASHVTIENLALTGAEEGVFIRGASIGVTLSNDTMFGNANEGIYLANGGTISGLTIADSVIRNNASVGIAFNGNEDFGIAATLSNNQVYDNAGDGIDVVDWANAVTIAGGSVFDNMGLGLSLTATITVSGVQVYGNAKDGIDVYSGFGPPTVSGDTVYSNAKAGIYAEGGLVTGNLVYDQVGTADAAIELDFGATGSGNTVYGSSTGLGLEDTAEALNNVVYGSSGDGISLEYTNYNYTITGNILYGNEIGIGGGGTSSEIENNLIYNNVASGIAITSGATLSILNNTVYQPTGQALTLAGVSDVTVENNILWVNVGDIVNVASGATTGFLSDYNLYYLGADSTPATLGLWQGTTEATLSGWQTASGQDKIGSKVGNPDFVDMTGADGIIGGPGTPVGAGYDDDFELQKGSPAINAGNGYAAPATDLLGQAPHDDPATANGPVLYVQSNSAAVAPGGGTLLSVPADGGVATYTLPFSFSFFGVSYSSVIVSSQGYLQFAGPDDTGGDTPSMAGLLANARIAPFWSNFNTAAATGDGVFVSATATSVTFRWLAGLSSNPVNVAVTLNSNGSFSFAYGAGNANRAPVIGVSAGNGVLYALSTANGNATMANAAVETWTPHPGDAGIGALEFLGNSADTTPPTVVSVTPIPVNNGTTGLAFTSLTVSVSEPLDLVSADSPANDSLIRADSNGQFNTTGAVAIPVDPVYVPGSTTVTLRLPNGALAPGEYQLTLSGTRAIFDTSGNALAGNGTTTGTNYVTVFTINRASDVAPVATAQSVTVAEDASVQIVLAATDQQGNSLTYSVATPPAQGAVPAIVNGDTLTYTPDANFFGADSFVFQATDPDGESSQASVGVTITPIDQPPVALAQNVSVMHDMAQLIVLGGSDAETPASELIYAIATQPSYGTLTAVPGNGDAFVYTPEPGYLGVDDFSFTVTDTGNPAGNLSDATSSAPATVEIAVLDSAPLGVPARFTTRENVPLNVPAATGVLASDLDSAGDALTAALATGVAHGTLLLNANGSFVYTPAAGFSGTDSFTYMPHGAFSVGASVTVTITVAATGAAPPTPPSPPSGGLAAPAAGLPVSGGGGAGIATADAEESAVTGTAAATGAAAPVLAGATPAAIQLTSAARIASAVVAGPLAETASAGASPIAAVALPSRAVLAMPAPWSGPWADTPGLAPIVLPDITVPGDETSSLMLPAIPEISQLPRAFAAAARRYTEVAPSVITFVDPVNGADADQPVSPMARDQAWLLVDPSMIGDTDGDGGPGLAPSPIRWESHTP